MIFTFFPLPLNPSLFWRRRSGSIHADAYKKNPKKKMTPEVIIMAQLAHLIA